MKKLLLFAAAAGVVMAGWAALPERQLTPGGAIKQLTKREASRHMAPQVYSDAPEAVSVPFIHSLGKNEPDVTNQYLVIDANQDSKTWKPGGFSTYSVCMSPTNDEADDWLISPAISLEGGEFYTGKFDYDMTLSKIEDKLALFAGTEQSVDGMTLTVVPEFPYCYNNQVFQTKEAQFMAPESGE